jgi:phenylacetate-CoA ligase
MSNFLYKIYYNLPPMGRDIVATLEGVKLRWWRYGDYYRNLLPEIEERESWNWDRLRAYQERSFLELLDSAVTNVPFYRDLFNRNGLSLSDLRSLSDISKLPILEKETLRQNPRKFLDERLHKVALHLIQTSGTTGTPLQIWFSRRDMQRRYAYQEMRIRRWWGVSLSDPYAMVGGKLVVPFNQTKPPFWVWNAALNQLYMSSYHLSPQFAEYYLKELKKRRLAYIFGYASSLYFLAYFAKEKGIDDIKFKVAFSNAEPLYEHQRQLIEKVFRCRTVDHYSNSECVCLAAECREGKLHISPEVGIIEIVDSKGRPVENGTVGDLVCTGLVNFTMPLIRYRVGDRGAISRKPCSCKSQFAILERIEGRNDDVLITKDGRRVGRLDPVFKANLGIREAQIIQESTTHVTVRYVTGPDFRPDHAKEIALRLKERMGEIKIELVPVSAIQRTISGKFRAVINNIRSPSNSP